MSNILIISSILSFNYNSISDVLKNLKLLLFGFSFNRSGIFSAGNAPAMRVSVLGLLCNNNTKLKNYVKRATFISHTDAKAYRGALAIAVAANMAGKSKKKDPKLFLKRFRKINNSKKTILTVLEFYFDKFLIDF